MCYSNCVIAATEHTAYCHFFHSLVLFLSHESNDTEDYKPREDRSATVEAGDNERVSAEQISARNKGNINFMSLSKVRK